MSKEINSKCNSELAGESGYVVDLLNGCDIAIAELNSLQYERCNSLGIEQSSNGIVIILEQLVERVRAGK